MIRLSDFRPRARPSLLPPAAAGEPWLMTVIAVLCFLACLTAVAASAADRAAHGWARRLGAEATVQVRPRVAHGCSPAEGAGSVGRQVAQKSSPKGVRWIERRMDGSNTYTILGSQTFSRSAITVTQEGKEG